MNDPALILLDPSTWLRKLAYVVPISLRYPLARKGWQIFVVPAKAGTQRWYGASGEDKASSSLETTDGVPHAAAE